MISFGAFPLRANGDTAPLGVQLSSPGPESPKCRGTNSVLVLALMLAPLLIVVTVALLCSL